MFKWSVIAGMFSLAVMLGAAGTVHADESQANMSVAGVYVPQPQRGAGDACVADTDFMRRNHMKLLDHQRDDTVHDGIRTERFSLKGCITCHAVKDETGTPVTVKDERHFCRTCHDYAAVKVDCFQCHASRPEVAKSAGVPADHTEFSALASYLEGLKK